MKKETKNKAFSRSEEERLKAKGALIAERMKEVYPDSACALEYEGDPWRLLVMARLSAQCTDARVNIVCRELFEVFPDCGAMASGELFEIERIVKPCGLYRGKAKSIKEASELIINEYGGKVPDTMEELLSLPGVGRKIANLILGDVYGKGGIVADTHCMRICGRFGFYDEDLRDPVKTEMIMDKYVERAEQSAFCHRIVNFGREYCDARRPKCDICPVADLCDAGKKQN
ncbi:MAG: endonuclease III [Clostridia bacterium]|nr:endonuclease III [Clostridia bacterium]